MLVKTILKRISYSLLLIYLMITLIFVLIRLAPGDPMLKFFDPELSPELVKLVTDSFQLNQSIFEQYVSFVKNLTLGDFGVSYIYHQNVFEVIIEYLPVTILLAVLSIVLQIFAALILSFILDKLNKNLSKKIENMMLPLYSVPTFVLALFLIYLFSYRLNLLPSSGLSSIITDDISFFSKAILNVNHFILPVISLSFAGTIVLFKYFYQELKKQKDSTFVRKLIIEGESKWFVLFKNILPNAAAPSITILGVEFGLLLSGALVTEVIFALPGMGRLTLDAILARDYPLVIGTVFTSSLLVILANLAADILRTILDKRYAYKLLK